MAFSYKDYTGDGVTDTFTITFTYQSTDEISVTVNGVAETGLTFPSTTSVQLTSAPASDALVRVRRTTDLDARAVDFASGSVLTEEDLDNSNIQVFHAAQEAVDTATDAIALDDDDKFDAQSKIIKNVADPVNNQDAVTKNYLENTWLTTADKAQLNSLDTDNLDIVAGNTSNINAVAADATDIGTVSTNIASVNTVATNISDVITVANDLNEAISEIETAADDLNEAVSEIDTVATSISSVNTVGTNISDVNTVAGNIANVNTVAGNTTNINTISGISGNVTTVAGISSDVTTVAADGTDIGTVATNIANVNSVAGNATNINNVAGNATNINTVAGISADVTTVAGDSADIQAVAADATDIGTVSTNIANVNTVAGISANVTAVAGDATDIGTVAADLAGTDTIGTVATNIANVNSVGGSITNVNTVATNISSVNDFADKYRIGASDPTTSLDEGDLFYNTTTDTLKVYTGSAWEQGVTAGSGFLPTTGGSVTGDINFGDNDKAIFGAGSDLQIYHDGSNSYIRENGTGALNILGQGQINLLNSAGDETLAKFLTNSKVELYYDNSKKIETTSTGVDVTGTIASDGLTVDGDSDLTHTTPSNVSTMLTLRDNRTTTSEENYILAINRQNSTTPAIYLGNNDSNNAIIAGNNTATLIGYDVSGTFTSSAKFNNNGDISFYDSTGVTQGLFWDASTQRLGIGTSSPSRPLTVSTTNNVPAEFDHSDGTDVWLKLNNTTQNYYVGYVGTDFVLSPDTVTRDVTITSGGNVGIGTSSPSANLHVSGSGARKIDITDTGGANTRISTANNNSYVGSTTNHPLLFITNDIERMRLDSSGNVGIGKTPSTALDVNGTVTATAFVGDGSGLTGVSAGATLHAWANFNQTGTQTINDSVGISSLTDNGGGTTTLNFSSAMANTTFTATSGHMNGGTKFQYHDSDSASNVKVINRDVDGGGGEDGDEIATQVAGDAA